MDLPESIMHIGPFYEYDREKKEFKKPVLTVTRESIKRKYKAKNRYKRNNLRLIFSQFYSK